MELKRSTTRRDFIKSTGKVALALGATALIPSCGMKIIREPEDISTIKFDIDDNPDKINLPKNGCAIGFHGLWERKPSDWNPKKDNAPKFLLNTYKNQIGHVPAILTRYSAYSDMMMLFPATFVHDVAESEVIPFVYMSILAPLKEYGSLSGLIDNLKFRQETQNYAQGLIDLGQKAFICTMREINIETHPWTRQPRNDVKRLWRQMHNDFEEVGANKYATWIYEPSTMVSQNYGKSTMFYYPGDEYVDYIGWSGYSRRDLGHMSFEELFGRAYDYCRDELPHKAQMIAEFGRTRDEKDSQAKWLIDAFKTLKQMPAVQAAIYWNNANPAKRDDKTLSSQSSEVYKHMMDEGYFYGTYRK